MPAKGNTMSRQSIAATLLLLLPATAWAQDTGVPACEAFLRAYAQCAASAKGPEVMRSGIAQAVETMRSSYLEDARRGNAGLRRLAARCPTEHEMVRTSITKNVQCDFPAATATAAPVLNAQELITEKVNAWVEAQNFIVQWEKFEQQLASYENGYAKVPKPGAKLRPDADYSFSLSGYDQLIERLRKAAAMPASVPGVDEAGGRLLAVLEPLNPLIIRLKRYRDTRGFQEDGFALARELHPAVLRGMQDATKAAVLFSSALSERELVRDEQLVTTLPDGSLPKLMLQTSLAARRVLRAQEALEPKGDTKALAAAVSALAASNTALHDKLDSTQPKPESSCMRTAEDMDGMVGKGREIAGGGKRTGTSNELIRAYNNGVDHMSDCRKALARRDG
jgi:hypothetical protein